MGQAREADLEEAKNKEKKHTLKDGKPSVNLDDRSCTDIIPCILYIIMLAIMIGITGYALGTGDLMKIATKYDMYGAKCLGDTPNKLFTELYPRTYTNQYSIPEAIVPNVATAYYSVCVAECPINGTDDMVFLPNEKYPEGSYALRTWDIDTAPFMGFCIPDLDYAQDMAEVMYGQLNQSLGSFGRYMVDLQETWRLILIMGIASFFVTIIYMFLLRWITKPILFVSLGLILLMGGLITGWCAMRMQKFPPESDDYKYSMAGAIVSGVVTLLYFIFLCCNCTNIKIGADIMSAAGEFVSSNSRIVFVPLVCYLVCLPIVAWYAAVNVYLYSTGEPVYKQGQMFAILEEKQEVFAMFWIFMFGFFWIVAWIIAILQFTIAATTALWYFQGANSDMENVSVMKGIHWAFRYHLGSLAFGSLLIAITTMIKVIFEYFAKKYEKLAGDNVIVKAVICYIRCMIWCLDACVKFISENAYIQVAIHGSSFCEGAKNGFFMMLRNPGTYTAMNIVGWIMTAIGKGTVMGICVYITILLAQNNVLVSTPGTTVQQPFVPAFVVLLISWLVSGLFISVFDFSCLTILQCFLTCKETQQDGQKIYAPKSLQAYLRTTGEPYLEGEDDEPKKGDSGKADVPANKVE